MKNFSDKYPGSDVIAVGDYNFRFIDWNTETINKKGIPVEEQQQAELFINYTHQQLLSQMVTQYTRMDKSILDLILTTDTEMIHNISVEKTKSSDHDLVRCNFLHSGLQIKKETCNKTFQQKHPLDTLNFGRADWNSINSELKEINWDSEMSEAPVEDMYKKLESKIISGCAKHTPIRKRGSGRNKIPSERLALIRKKKRLNAKINHRKYVSANKSEKLIQKLEAKKAEVEESIKKSIRVQNERKEMDPEEEIEEIEHSYLEKQMRIISECNNNEMKIFSRKLGCIKTFAKFQAARSYKYSKQNKFTPPLLSDYIFVKT